MDERGCQEERHVSVSVANARPDGVQRVIVTTKNIEPVCQLIRRETVAVGLDTETTGLTEKDRLFSLIISTGTHCFYFNFQDYKDGSPVLPRGYIKKIINCLHMQMVFIQNAKFDLRMLSYEGADTTTDAGFTLPIFAVCTETMARIIRNDHMSYSLAEQAKRVGLEKDGDVDLYIKKHKLYDTVVLPDKDKKVQLKHFDQVPFDIISKYGFMDAILHRELGVRYAKEIKACPYKSKVLKNESRLTSVCYHIERRGIFLNWSYTTSARDWEVSQAEAAREEFAKIAGEAFANTREQAIRLYTREGEKIPLTEKGNPSFTADTLDTFKTPLAVAHKKIRQHEKRIATYYSSFLHYRCEDGRIRADIRQAGTTTGRFSYRDPNLQNLPKDEESRDPYVVRGCFQPSPGFVFYSLDYSQLEYRLMLDYAGEHRLIADVKAGADVHQAMADMVGITRSYAKTLNFAILYGSGAEEIANMLGISIRDALELRSLYFIKLPRVGMFIDRVQLAAKNRGYVRNWLGRHCYLKDRSFAYAMPNHLIQGGGADVIKKAMVDSEHLFDKKKSGIVLQVHDELVVEVARGEEDIVWSLAKIMENTYVPMNGMDLKVNVEMSEVSLAKRDLYAAEAPKDCTHISRADI